MLDAKRVGHVVGQVEQRADRDRDRERRRGPERTEQQDRGHCLGDAGGHDAGSDRAVLFRRMIAVGLGVDEVVERVDRAGQQREDRERRRSPQRNRGLEQVLREHHGREDEEILHPLLGAKGLDQTDEHGRGAYSNRLRRPAFTSAACALAALLVGTSARAQVLSDEWLATHSRDASSQVREARGVVPLLRLYAMRDWVDPSALVERLHAVASDVRAPAMRRAQALQLEANVREGLGEVHEAREITRSLGFLTQWAVIGPFDNEGRAGFGRAMPPEDERAAPPDLTRSYEGREHPVRWRAFPDISRNGGYVSLDAVSNPSQNVCSFAHTTVRSPRDEDTVLWLGAGGQLAAWFNAAPIYRDETVRRAWPDRVGIRVRLRRGANRLLLKVCTDNHPLGFYARFTRPDGTPRADLVADADPTNAPAQTLPAPIAAGAHPVAPALLGAWQDLRIAAEVDHPSAQALEDFARFLALTGTDNASQPQTADLAGRAARDGPTVQRWLFAADVSENRNVRLGAIGHALALSPNDPHVLTAMAHERRMGAHPEDAMPWLARAIAADDANAVARIERALLYESIELRHSARRELVDAVIRAPRAPAVLRLRAQVAERSNVADEARDGWIAYLRVRYNDLAAHESLSRDARARGDVEVLRREADRLVALRPDRLGVYTTAADLLEAAHQGEAARGTLVRATEIAPDDAGIWQALGELEVRLGHADDGRARLRRALALRPQETTWRRRLESLEPPVPRADEALAEAPDVFLARRHGAGRAVEYRARTLQDLTVRTVYPNGLADNFRQVAIEVLNQEGALGAREYSVQYSPGTQRFELRAARVHHVDGSADESTSLQEYGLQGGASRMYFDERAAVVTFPTLRPGDVIEVRWRVSDVSDRNAFADYFGDVELMQSDTPRAQTRYVLRAPASRQFYFHVPTLPRLQRSERTEGDTHVFDFVARDVDALPPESHAPGWTERAAYLHVSTYRTWEDVGRWYWGLISDQLQADDRVRTIVREVTRGLTTPRDRVRAIYNWVIHNTRYVALEFGIHGLLPYRVPLVCARGFGDCKDKASTIVTMLREVGIDASIVLVRTRNNGRIDTTPASLAVFDHAIAYVPPMDGYPNGLYLDGTAQSSGMDELPPGDQGAMGLVINQRGEARLVEIPVTPADRNTDTARTEVTVNATGGATMHQSREFRGPTAGAIRALLEAQATRVERLERQLTSHYPGVRVSDVRAGDMNLTEQPARFEFDASIPQLAVRQGDGWLLPLFAPLNLTREYAERSTRTTDVLIEGPIAMDERRTIRLPPGATLQDVPAPIRIDSPFVRMEVQIERQGTTLSLHRTITYLTNRVPVAQYTAFRETCQRIDEALGRRATLQLPSAQP